MNTSPPYLRVGPVAIHIRSRETDRQPASPPSDYPFAEPTLVVQGSVFLSPDNGAFVEELNGVPVPSNTVNASPSAPPPPAPPSVASVPSPSISPSIVNAGYSSAPNLAPIPSGASSVQELNSQRNSSPGPQAMPTPTPSPTPRPGTEGNSPNSSPVVTPNSVPASSPKSGAQPTVLAGSATDVLSDLTSTSSLGPAFPTMPSVNSTASKNTTSIIVGSILAGILGIVLIVAIITWFLRVRSRRRSDDELSWDPEPNSYDGDSFFDAPSPFRASQDRIVPPARPRPPGPTIGFQSEFVEPHGMRAPYPHLATPEFAHTAGPLAVTNLMPGDVLPSANTSIFAGSRPGSTQVTPRIDNSAPRFMRLQDGGLPVPWSRDIPESTRGPAIRPRAWPSRLSASSLKKAFSSSPPKPTKPNPPQPRTSAANLRAHFNSVDDSNIQLPEPARTADQTWPGTIRAGFTNALNAVIGTSVRPPEPPGQNLTPIRPRPNRRLSSKTGMSTLDSMSRTSTPSKAVNYTMEETGEGRGVVRVHSLGYPHEAPLFNEAIREETEDGSDANRLPSLGFSPLEDAPANIVISEETPAPSIPRLPNDVVGRPSSVPRLPTIRPLSRAWTLRNEGFVTLPESDDGYRSAFNRMISERKQEYDRHLAELEAIAVEEETRPIMSRASTTSLMTESTTLSRQSSSMDDEERKAKKVLRMRRKRAMALSATGVGNGKIIGRRTSLRKNAMFRGV